MIFRKLDTYRFLFSLTLCLVAVFAVAQYDGPPQRGQGGGHRDVSQDKELLEGIPPALRKMIEQASKNTYAGSRRVEFRKGPERKTHIEYILKDGPRMRITFPKDSEFAGQVIAEDGKERQQYFPDRNEIEKAPSHYDELTERLYGMLRAIKKGFAKVTSRDGDKVAGLDTQFVEVTDRAGNPMQRFWIEPRTGILLKREIYNPVGLVDASFEFTSINLRPRFNKNDVFPIIRRGAKYLTMEDVARRTMQKEGFAEAFLPASDGYDLQSTRMFEHEGKKVLFMFYRNKEKIVSLFQIQGSVEPNLLKRLSEPNFRTHTWTVGSRTFVIIGQLTDSEFDKLEDKVRNPEA